MDNTLSSLIIENETSFRKHQPSLANMILKAEKSHHDLLTLMLTQLNNVLEVTSSQFVSHSSQSQSDFVDVNEVDIVCIDTVQ